MPTDQTHTTDERRRSGARAAWIVIASVFAVLALGWATLGVADFLARSTTTQTSTHPIDQVEVVDIEVDSGTVIVGADAGESVVVGSELRRGILANRHREDLVDGVLSVRSHCPRMSQWGSCRADVTVQVPAGVQVRVHSSHGDVEIDQIAGDVEVTSMSGDLRLNRLAGAVKAHTSHGTIWGDNLATETVEATTFSGRITLSLAVEPSTVVARSSHGDVEVTVPASDTAYRVDASSSHGDVTENVRTDPRSDRSIEAHTSSGHVTVDYQTSP